MNHSKEVRAVLQRVELTNTPTVIITERLQKQIDFLHHKCGAREWSGELIVREEGSISEMSKWRIYCEDIFLADVGSAGYTEYTVDSGGFKAVDIFEMYDRFPELLEGKKKNMHIHTHHTMDTFFSSVDWDNLQERAIASNYTLMLITNIAGKYIAKVAFRGKIENTSKKQITFLNNEDKIPPISITGTVEPEESLIVMDCNIETEIGVQVDKWFSERYDLVKEATNFQAVKRYPSYQDRVEEGRGRPVGTLNRDRWGGTMKNGVWVDNKLNEDNGVSRYEAPDELDFDARDARVLMNCILDKTYIGTDSGSPIEKLRKLSLELKTPKNIDEKAFELLTDIEDHFNKTFPNGNEDDYLTVLRVIKTEILNSHRYIDLVRSLIDEIGDEVSKLNKKRVDSTFTQGTLPLPGQYQNFYENGDY